MMTQIIKIVRIFFSILIWLPILVFFLVLILGPLSIPFIPKFQSVDKLWAYLSLVACFIITYMAIFRVIQLDSIISKVVTGEAIAALVVGFVAFAVLPVEAKSTGLIATGLFTVSLTIGLVTLSISAQYSMFLIPRLFTLVCTLYAVYGLIAVVFTILILLSI